MKMAEHIGGNGLHGKRCSTVSDIDKLKSKIAGIDGSVAQNREKLNDTAGKVDGLLMYVKAIGENLAPRLHMPPISINSSTTSLSSSSEDERMRHSDYITRCMSDAFQCNIEKIIKCTPFDSVHDEVVQRDLVTMEESQRMREFQCDRDRMRFLVTNIMDKNFASMSGFLDLMGKIEPGIKECIQNAFQSRIDSEVLVQHDDCTTCLIQRRVEIQVIADPLYEQCIIDHALYKDIAVNMNLADKSFLWQRLFQTVSQLPRKIGAKSLKNALSRDEDLSFHDDIVRHIERDLARNRSSCRCRCNRNKLALRSSPCDLSSSRDTISSNETNTSDDNTSTCSSVSRSVHEFQKSSIRRTSTSPYKLRPCSVPESFMF